MDGIAQVLTDILGDGELIAHLEFAAGKILGQVQILAGGIGDIRNPVAGLIVFQVFLDSAQFFLDNDQPVLDEIGRIPGRTVLVADPVFVVDIQQGAEDAFRTTREEVLDGQNNHGRLLGGKIHVHAGAIALGSRHGRSPGNADIILPVIEMDRRTDPEGSHRRHQGISQRSGYRIHLEFVPFDPEILQDKGLRAGLGDHEREVGCHITSQQREHHGCTGIQFTGPEELEVGIICFQIQAADDLLHQVRRGEGLHLVVHICAPTIPHPVVTGKGGQVTHHGRLGIFVHNDLLYPAVRIGGAVQVEYRK